LFDLSGVENLKIKRDFGVLCTKASQGRRQDVLGWDHDCCQIKASNDYLSQVGSLAFRGCDSLEQFIRVMIEKNTGFSQVNPPTDTSKKRDPEFGFQLMDLIRDIGLADMKFLGSPRKVRMSSNGLENPETCYGD
jgi:hypothetical protein